MTSYLLDTNHASLLFRRIPAIVAAFDSRLTDQIQLCMPSVAELWFMVHNSARRDENARDMMRFIADFDVLDFTPQAAEHFGIIKAELRRLGRPIPDVDVQIAAIARTANLALVSDDSHFNSIEGLVVENWLRS